MAVFQAPVPGREAQPISPGKRAKHELVGLLLLCLLISIYVSFRKTQQILEHHDLHVSHKEGHAQQLPVRPVGTEPLAHEDIFSDSIKSCFPETNNNCKLFVPEHTTAQRIAILAPPGKMEKGFFRLLQVVVGRARRKKNVDIELVSTSHVPPYGYGKTHGWTRIIRIVPQPLLLGVTNALVAHMNVEENLDSITLEEIKASLRQQIRYHCRLSHVAAHTALWSISLEAFYELSVDELIEQIQIFLALDKDDIFGEITEREGASAEDLPPDDLESVFYEMASIGASMLTHAQIPLRGSILKELDDVLMEEMRISKNLTAWPCESLWTVGDPSKNPLDLSPIVSRIAESMSPNCTASFTSCFVKKDLCEAKGDGKCRSKE